MHDVAAWFAYAEAFGEVAVGSCKDEVEAVASAAAAGNHGELMGAGEGGLFYVVGGSLHSRRLNFTLMQICGRVQPPNR